MNTPLRDSTRLRWGVILRVAALGLFVGAFVGAVYGAVSMLILSLIGRLVEPSRFSNGSSDAMLPALMAGGLIGGLMLGAFIGLLSGLAAGLALGILLRTGLPGLPGPGRTSPRLAVITGAVCGLVTLAQTTLSGLPSRLTPAWPLVGWMLWVMIPTVLAFFAGWWAARREIELSQERGSA
jgi:hypothetical protein